MTPTRPHRMLHDQNEIVNSGGAGVNSEELLEYSTDNIHNVTPLTCMIQNKIVNSGGAGVFNR